MDAHMLWNLASGEHCDHNPFKDRGRWESLMAQGNG